MATVKDIVIAHLKLIGADGLFNPEGPCGCGIDEFPVHHECGMDQCQPAWAGLMDFDGEITTGYYADRATAKRMSKKLRARQLKENLRSQI